MILTIDKLKNNKKCYVKQINEYIDHQTKHGNNVKLNYYKILGDTFITHTFYDESLSKWYDDVKNLKDGYFSPHKDYLFSIMEDKAKGNNTTCWNNLILYGLPGTGKCMALNTPILMYDGSICKVQNIQVDDLVMGDDSTSRRVLSLARGRDQMYNVKHGDTSYVVNSRHVLSLVYPNKKYISYKKHKNCYVVKWFDNETIVIRSKNFYYTHECDRNKTYKIALHFLNSLKENLYVDICVKDYIKLEWNTQTKLQGYKVGVKFDEKKLWVDPYIVGLWLSSNFTNFSNFSKTDIYLSVMKLGDVDNNNTSERICNIFKKYDMLKNKHIPKDYKINSRQNRLKLLAGLLDGRELSHKKRNEYEIVQKNAILSNDIIFLCKSLGFSVTIARGFENNRTTDVYYCMRMSGKGLKDIPIIYPHDKYNADKYVNIHNINLLRTEIVVTPTAIDDYYGFELDGNHRFVMGNFIVTHNSSFIYRIATLLKMSILSVDLSLYIDKKKELYAMFHGQEFSLPNNDNIKNSSHNCIIILEEFDNCVEKLLELENIFKFKQLVMKEHFSTKENDLKIKINAAERDLRMHNLRTNKLKQNTKINKPKAICDMDFDEYQNSIMMEDGFGNSGSCLSRERDNLVKTRKYDNKLSMVNLDLNNIIKNINDDNKSDILRFSDLLELFQGPVPIKDRMILATTNYYDKIKNTLPALFRPGRLTPLHFGYLDWESYIELCQYYFNSNPTYEEFKIIIPTSQIIELAIKNSVIGKNFILFEENIHIEIELKKNNGKPPRNKSSQDKPPQDKPPQDKPPQDKSPQDKPPQNKPPQNKPPQNKPPQNKSPQDKPPQNKPPQNKPYRDVVMWCDAFYRSEPGETTSDKLDDLMFDTLINNATNDDGRLNNIYRNTILSGT